MDQAGFLALMERVADGWNRGTADAAAACFTTDAVYVEPPDRQRYVGRDALLAFFRGDGAGTRTMSMAWHRVAFDAGQSTGFGEYTFTIPGRFQAHGVAVVTLLDGLIASWREYQYPSALPFTAFAGDSLLPPAGG